MHGEFRETSIRTILAFLTPAPLEVPLVSPAPDLHFISDAIRVLAGDPPSAPVDAPGMHGRTDGGPGTCLGLEVERSFSKSATKRGIAARGHSVEERIARNL